MSDAITIVLGLGTNRGDRLGYLRMAKKALGGFVSHIVSSPVYESAAMLPENAPADWDTPFYNIALIGETKLTPQALLREVKRLEKEIGRQDRGHWGPREIDIDILAYGDASVDEPDLVIPHTGLLTRDFALVPLADVHPHWQHPKHNKPAHELAAPLRQTIAKTEHSLD